MEENEDEDEVYHAITLTKYILQCMRKTGIKKKSDRQAYKLACQTRAVLIDPEILYHIEQLAREQLEAEEWKEPPNGWGEAVIAATAAALRKTREHSQKHLYTPCRFGLKCKRSNCFFQHPEAERQMEGPDEGGGSAEHNSMPPLPPSM